MKQLVLIFGFILSFDSFGASLEFLTEAQIPHKSIFKKTKIGGLSGLYYDSEKKNLYAISDDRGNINEPRFYTFDFDLIKNKNHFELKINPKEVTFLSVNQTEKAHSSKKAKAKLFSKVLDLEAISRAPWGDFLMTNEGDMNQIPRVNPQLLDVKMDGTIVREFEIPAAFLPGKSGIQTKGVQNNLAFESLAANPNGKEWIMATEASLVKAPKNSVKFIQYTMPEAWVLKPGKEWNYPIDGESIEKSKDRNNLIPIMRGISEVTFLDEQHLWVLERGLQVSAKGMQFLAQIYETELGATVQLEKKLILDLNTLRDANGKAIEAENYEGMTIGPPLPTGENTLIVVSDDNFMRNQVTKFLVFKILP